MKRTLSHYGLACLVLLQAVSGSAWAASENKQLEPPLSSLKVGEVNREYFLYPSGDSEPAPLLIVLHGAGGTVRSVRSLGFEELARRHVFSVVYPRAIGGYWINGLNKSHAKKNPKIDDIEFLGALIDKLVVERVADPARIYVTGISNGGVMAYRAGCELSGILAAIAPVSASLPADYDCKPQQRLAVLAINGTADPLMPWNGGATGTKPKEDGRHKRKGDDQGEVLSVEDTLGVWHQANQCNDDDHQVETLPRKVERDHSFVMHHRWGECGVELYEIRGGGHMWPGRRSSSALLFGRSHPIMGHESMQLDATETIWHFVENKAKP